MTLNGSLNHETGNIVTCPSYGLGLVEGLGLGLVEQIVVRGLGLVEQIVVRILK